MFWKVPHQYFALNQLAFPHESCVLIFLLTTKCSKRTTVEDHHRTLSTQTCSPTSISSWVPLFVVAFKHKRKQTLVSSVYKADGWSWKTINAEEPLISSSNQNTWRDKLLTVWFCCTRWQGTREWGEGLNAHRSWIITAQCLTWKCKQLFSFFCGRGGEKKYNHLNGKGDPFY